MDNAYVQQLKADFKAFHEALSRESDRGCALFAAAYLDDALAKFLRTCMRADKRLDEDLFKGQAPLGSFSARIKLAYYLGAIDSRQRKDYDCIRDVRNHFAHHPEVATFTDQSIRDRCANLSHYAKAENAPPRHKFVSATSGLLGHINGMLVMSREHPGPKIHIFQPGKDKPVG